MKNALEIDKQGTWNKNLHDFFVRRYINYEKISDIRFSGNEFQTIKLLNFGISDTNWGQNEF